MTFFNRTTRLWFRRNFRRRRKKVEDLGYQTDDHLEKHFIRRLNRLFDVRRFVASWLTLIILLGVGVVLQTRALNGYYLELQPTSGGSYTEGMVGNFTNSNPLFASNLVDNSVSKLVFSGLFKYDDSNKLVGDLAQSWEVDETGKVYTVVLKPNLLWHDGQELTADDVVFTFQSAQNPDVKSPLFSGWRGIKIEAIDKHKIKFTLDKTLAPFIYSLTTGIVPKHSLQNTDPAQLRSSNFNTTNPIGSGPFRWNTIEILGDGVDEKVQLIGLKASDTYHFGKPKLQQFIIKTYVSEENLITSYNKQEVNALVGLEKIPDSLDDSSSIKEYTAPLTASNMVFFNTKSPLLKDVKLRQAFVQAVDVPSIIAELGYPVVDVDQPFIRSQASYNSKITQLQFNKEAANKLLEGASWTRSNAENIRSNGKENLTIKLIARNNADNTLISRKLQKFWREIGINLEVRLLDNEELQIEIDSRNYDALVYGISLGNDPDVFPYWHSTQADTRSVSRLNFSNYESKVADEALEAGRSRLDPELRKIKYQPFLEEWRKDAPAIALYQPRFLYITKGDLFGINPKSLNTASDRFASVENWMVLKSNTLKSD